MSEFIIFGGTTEGRLLAEFCHDNQIHANVSVTSDYGRELLPESRFLQIDSDSMDQAAMEQYIKDIGARLVFDATHPYATEATANICMACNCCGVEYVRVLRGCETNSKKEAGVVRVTSMAEAMGFLRGTEGNILVTTGSKELPAFTEMVNFQERVYARVLPSASIMETCEKLGFTGKHLIGMQGPFSEEMNQAMMKQWNIRYLVTKEAGAAGGFGEKLAAAAKTGVAVIVVGRPQQEDGISVEEAKKRLFPGWSLQKRQVYLIGIGMGGDDQLTAAGAKLLKRCDAVLGAPRMLQSVEAYIKQAVREPRYLSQEVLEWIESHREYRHIGITYSGDTGFYSGAESMAKVFLQEPYQSRYEISVIPGISSVSYLCAKLKIGWEKVSLMSNHARDGNVLEKLAGHDQVFLLLGGDHGVRTLCETLIDGGYEDVLLSVGQRLSYPEEQVITGRPGELLEGNYDSLSSVLIQKASNDEVQDEG